MNDRDQIDPRFDALTARLLRREALRRAAQEINAGTGVGLEHILSRISAEVTAAAVALRAAPPAPPPPLVATPRAGPARRGYHIGG